MSPFTGACSGCASTIGSAGPPSLSHVSGISTPGVACFGATVTQGAGIGTGCSPGAPSFPPPAPSVASGTHAGVGGHH
eukprot:691958-Amphidinium_carterae.1